MASRNERKRRAKARHAELKAAVEQAFASQKVEIIAPRQDVFDVPQALRGHRAPQERLGTVVRGRFQAATPKEPAKRTLVFDKAQGRMIERRKRAI